MFETRGLWNVDEFSLIIQQQEIYQNLDYNIKGIMGQENSSPHSIPDDLSDAVFQTQTSTKYNDRLKQAFRISTMDQSQTKNEEIDVSEILEEQESQVLKQKIQLLPAHESKQIKQIRIYEGILQKQSPTVFGNWDKRYCCLENGRFRYKKNEDKNSEDAGILNFDLLSCYIVTNKKGSKIENFAIKIEKSEKQFVFKASSEKETELWAEKLKIVTNESIGKKFNMTYLATYNRFWRKQYLSEEEFREKSETGDLILMRGKAKSSVIQRAITLQQFDHIAFVLKNIRHQVLLFEATGGVGVGIMPWKKFVGHKWFKNQEIVVYRKLNINRTEQFMQQVQNFVERNMGRKYKFSVKKYFMNRESEEQKDNKSYFCSSLIGKIYKQLELLDPKISSTQYRPSSFAQKSQLQLKQAGKFGKAYLERERIVVFETLFFDKNK